VVSGCCCASRVLLRFRGVVVSRGVIRWAHILREGAWLRMRIVESECSLAVYAEVEVLGWGFAASSGIRIRSRCRFVFLGHRRRLEKLERGDGRIDDENEPRLPSWFVFVTYCVSLPLPGASLLFLQPTLEVPSSFSSSFLRRRRRVRPPIVASPSLSSWTCLC
jgi:hypothetical protein